MKKFKYFFSLILLASFFLAQSAWSATTVPSEAKIVSMTGKADYKKAGATEWVELTPDMVLSQGDWLKTWPASEVVLELTGNKKTANITVREKSKFQLKTFSHNAEKNLENTLLDVEVGTVLVKAEKLEGASKFQVKTPTSIVGIRGTTFEVNVAPAK